MSSHNPSLRHALRYCENKLTEQEKRIKLLKEELGTTRNRLKGAASQLFRIKHWGIEMLDGVTESKFFNEVFLVLCEK